MIDDELCIQVRGLTLSYHQLLNGVLFRNLEAKLTSPKTPNLRVCVCVRV